MYPNGGHPPARLRLSGVSDASPEPEPAGPPEPLAFPVPPDAVAPPAGTPEAAFVPEEVPVNPFSGAGLPTEGWTVPTAPVAPPIRRPVRGRQVLLGGGFAFGGHTLALVVTFIIAFTGSVYDSTWVVVVAMEVMLFFACLVCGIVWITSRDRGIGIGLLVGWPVGLLVPVVVIGFYVLGMVAPLSAMFRAEVS